nr:unnamed protein product [Spirometra erinaceieuropaei]
MTISNCALKTAEGLTGLRIPMGHVVVDFGAAGEGAGQIRGVVRHLHLGSVHAGLPRIVERGCVNDHTEVLAGGGEEIHAPLLVSCRGCFEGAVVSEEKFVNCDCVYARLEVHQPLIEEVAVPLFGRGYSCMHLRARYCGLRWPDRSSRRYRRDEAPSGPLQEATSSNRPERKTALLVRELASYKVDIAALSETHFSEQGQLEEVGAGYTFWSGHCRAKRREAGVAWS